jgi:hypothetical protein
MIFESDIETNQIVYLVTDPEQKERIVTGVKFESGGSIIYFLGCAAEESYHQRGELSTQKDLNKLLGIDQDKQA